MTRKSLEDVEMMMNLPENHINRIDLGVDWSKCTKRDFDFLRDTIYVGNIQLNAECTNRLSHIAELEEQMAATDDTVLRDALRKLISQMWIVIGEEKRRGVFQDYGLLKRRIAEGASADEVYSMMPYAYAMAYDRVRLINARSVKQEKPLIALLLGGTTTLLGVFANIITIRDSDALSRLKELLQAFLRM